MTLRASPEARDWVRTIPRSDAGTPRAMLALRERTRFAEHDLARIIPVDASMQCRLQVVSSALDSQHFTMRDAITDFGYRGVHSVVVRCIMLDALNEVAPQRPYLEYWHRAAERGVISIYATAAHRAHWDLAFAAGLLSEIGALLREVYESSEDASAAGAPSPQPASADVDPIATDLALAFAEHWGLQGEILEALGGPPVGGRAPSICAVIETADRVAPRFRQGGSEGESLHPGDDAIIQRLEAMGGRAWVSANARELIALAFFDDGTANAA